MWLLCEFCDVVFVISSASDDMMCSGRSGGGKSSIHALLLRYYDPVAGKITFDGQGQHPASFFQRNPLIIYAS